MSVSNTTTLDQAIISPGTFERAGFRVRLDAFTLVLFSAAIFTSATLLFVIQPMVGKILLPLLGGAPSVWNTCMVFFQGTLLAGYLAAHLLTRYVPLRIQAIIFPLMLIGAMQTLPIAVGPEWSEQLLTGASPGWWLLMVLLANVAPVFFVMSMTSPLLQKWFAKSGHPHSDDPYFLYAASNIGSILALLLYPLLIEVQLGVTQQATTWLTGFGFFTVLATCCGVASWIGSRFLKGRAPKVQASLDAGRSTIVDRPLTWKRRAWWTLLAFVPSSLMLGVTTYISTDVSSIPLIWVVPLAMYLLTFVLAFSKRQIISAYWAGRIAALLILSITVTVVTGANEPQFLIVPMHLLMFFMVTLFCHQRLAADRPGTDHLTDFYLWLSVGGVLGGMFNALLAPSLFVTIIEYPLIMVLAASLRETRSTDVQTDWTKSSLGRLVVFGIAIFAGTIALSHLVNFVPVAWYDSLDATQPFASVRLKTLIMFGLPAALVLHQMEHRARFTVGLLAILSVSLWQSSSDAETLERDRNFYGTIATEKSELEQGSVIRMYHGNTVHGWQWTDAARRQIPLTYYGGNSGIGQAIASKSAHQESQNIGVIGLGTGTLAATLRANDSMTIYEINPQVVDHAERYFTYLQDARDRGADLTLKHGDARLVLESEIRSSQPNAYDILAVDAFSSDSIPAHLLTNECLQIYLRHLKQDGILAFHITNRYVNLEPVIAALAKANGLVGRSCHFRHASGEEFDPETGEMACSWIVLSRDAEVLNRLEGKHLNDLRFDPTKRLWTDDYSNVLSALEF